MLSGYPYHLNMDKLKWIIITLVACPYRRVGKRMHRSKNALQQVPAAFFYVYAVTESTVSGTVERETKLEYVLSNKIFDTIL